MLIAVYLCRRYPVSSKYIVQACTRPVRACCTRSTTAGQLNCCSFKDVILMLVV